MIHSRPGFQTVVIDDSRRAKSHAPAKLNEDMVPALAKRTTATTGQPSPVVTSPDAAIAIRMQAQAEAAFDRMKAKNHPQPAAPELIINPSPSPEVTMTSPHKRTTDA
jgi:hypothetical protein